MALDSELDREVALSSFESWTTAPDDPTSRFRFLIEAQITGGLEHPHGIVPVYGLGSYGDGRPYYAMLGSSAATASRKRSTTDSINGKIRKYPPPSWETARAGER